MPKWTGYLDEEFVEDDDYQQVERIPTRLKIEDEGSRDKRKPKKQKQAVN